MLTTVSLCISQGVIELATVARQLMGKTTQDEIPTGWKKVGTTGHAYAHTSGQWTEAQMAALTDPDVVASLDLPPGITADDMAALQASLVFDSPATPGKISVVVGQPAATARGIFAIEPIPPAVR